MFRVFGRSSPSAPEKKNDSLTELIAFHHGSHARWSGRDVHALIRSGFGRNPIVFACVNMIAEAAASVPLHVEQAGMMSPDHPLSHLLARPNPDQAGPTFLEALFGHLVVTGNAFVEVIQAADTPSALYLLRPDTVKIEAGADGWPAAYLHKAGNRVRRLIRDVSGACPVIHIRLFNPADDVSGQSPLAAAADAVDLHNAATAWNKALLDNAARPSGALVYRGPEGASNLTGAQFERLKCELSETYGGHAHAGRPMVLDGGLDWKPMSLSPAEMDFRELKNGAARDIALAFGVPSMLLGIPGDNTYANYAQANIAFWRQTVLPLVGKVAGVLSAALAGGDVRVISDEHAIDALHASRIDRLRLLLASDVASKEEKRRALGLPPSPPDDHSELSA